MSNTLNPPDDWIGARKMNNDRAPFDTWLSAYKERTAENATLRARVERLEADNEFLHKRRGELCIERDAARDRADLLAASLKVLNDEVAAERARAERLEAQLRAAAQRVRDYCSQTTNMEARGCLWSVAYDIDAALAEPAPGGQDAERKGGA